MQRVALIADLITPQSRNPTQPTIAFDVEHSSMEISESKRLPARTMRTAGQGYMRRLPSRFRTALMPMRSRTVGYCCSAGRYSLFTIDGGTFHVELTVMYFIVSLRAGVDGLPTTILVCYILVPLRTTFRVTSGMLTMT